MDNTELVTIFLHDVRVVLEQADAASNGVLSLNDKMEGSEESKRLAGINTDVADGERGVNGTGNSGGGST